MLIKGLRVMGLRYYITISISRSSNSKRLKNNEVEFYTITCSSFSIPCICKVEEKFHLSNRISVENENHLCIINYAVKIVINI
jgi:hypothetical protein